MARMMLGLAMGVVLGWLIGMTQPAQADEGELTVAMETLTARVLELEGRAAAAEGRAQNAQEMGIYVGGKVASVEHRIAEIEAKVADGDTSGLLAGVERRLVAVEAVGKRVASLENWVNGAQAWVAGLVSSRCRLHEKRDWSTGKYSFTGSIDCQR